MTMVEVKVTEPLPLIVTFYYYYSYLTLLGTWVIAPFLFYTIFTQSRKLGNYKWFILNHSFWCLAFETIYGLLKPMLLPPIGGGFLFGPFRYIWDFRGSLIFTVIGFGILGNCVISLCATLASRYLLIFPSTMFKWFNLKIALVVAVIVNLICYGLIVYALYPVIQLDHENIVQWADAEDSGLKVFYQKEPTFFIVPHEFHHTADIIILAFLVAVHIGGAFILLFFFYQLYKRSTLTNKLQRSLIVSSLAQMILTSIFLFVPVMFFFFFILFEIPNVTTFITFLSCVITSHSILEFFATFYFVTPYRNFILQLFHLQKPNLRPSNLTVVVTVF